MANSFWRGLDPNTVEFGATDVKLKRVYGWPIHGSNFTFALPTRHSNGAFFFRLPTRFHKVNRHQTDDEAVVEFYAVLYQGNTYVAVCHFLVDPGFRDPGTRRNIDQTGTYKVLNEEALGSLLRSNGILDHSYAARELGWTSSVTFDRREGSFWSSVRDFPFAVDIETRGRLVSFIHFVQAPLGRSKSIISFSHLGEWVAYLRRCLDESDELEGVTQTWDCSWEA